jgi:low affinity Fe/Cu permease
MMQRYLVKEIRHSASSSTDERFRGALVCSGEIEMNASVVEDSEVASGRHRETAGADVCPRCANQPSGKPAQSKARASKRSSGWLSICTFSTFARTLARWSGRPVSFAGALLLVFTWAVSGRFFDFSDTWQLVINTSTTIITFWMVFLIQHTQNRDTEAMQLKLDEIIRATQGAHNALMGLEDAADEEVEFQRQRIAATADEGPTGAKRGEPHMVAAGDL